MRPKPDGTRSTYVVYDPVQSFRTKAARELREHLRTDAYAIALWIDDDGPTWLGIGCDSRETAISLLEVHWQGWIDIAAMQAELGSRGIVDAAALGHFREEWLRHGKSTEAAAAR